MSVFLIATTRIPLGEMPWNFILEYSSATYWEKWSSIQFWQAFWLFYKVHACIYHNFSSVLLKVRSVSNKNIKKHILCLIFSKKLPYLENCKRYGSERQATDQTIYEIWRMRFVCCIKKSTNKHSEYIKQFFSTATTVRRTNFNVTFVNILPILDRNLNQISITSCSR